MGCMVLGASVVHQCGSHSVGDGCLACWSDKKEKGIISWEPLRGGRWPLFVRGGVILSVLVVVGFLKAPCWLHRRPGIERLSSDPGVGGFEWIS